MLFLKSNKQQFKVANFVISNQIGYINLIDEKAYVNNAHKNSLRFCEKFLDL